MNKRAVIYARVSSDDVREGKEGRNLAEQIKMGREYAEGKGYSIVAELAEDDRGASGARLDLPQVERFQEMARAGEFDVLVVREMDRLARRLAKQLVIEDELKRAGVEIEYVLATYENNLEGDLNKNIRAVVNEYEALKISERMTRGRRVKAKTGSVISHGHAPYGYNLSASGGKTGLIINPKEAEIVRLIFNWVSEGMSIRGIQRELTRLAVPTPADSYPYKTYHKQRGRGEWGRSTIYAILQNESYTGAWNYGKRSPKIPRSKQMVNNARETWIRVEIPSIIAPGLWEATRRTLAQHKEHGGGANVKYDYLLRGRLICGDCKGRMVATSNYVGGKYYFYYVCRSQRVGAKHGDYSYPSKLVDEIAWGWVRQLLLDPQAIGEGLAAYKREQEINTGPITMRISTVEGLLIDKRESLKRLLDLYLSGEFHKEMLIDKKADLEKTIAELEKERASLLANLEAQNITEEQEQTLIEFTRKIGKGLKAADANFKTRREVIEALGVEATLFHEAGQKTIRIKCILAEGYYVLSPAIRDGLAVVLQRAAHLVAGRIGHRARACQVQLF
jgi:site-specific DNA recombinase